MKKYILLLLLVLSFETYAQDQHQVSLGFGVGGNMMTQNDESKQKSTLYGEIFNTIELGYVYNFKQRYNRRKVMAIETGVRYNYHEILVSDSKKTYFDVINILAFPLEVRFNLPKYVYLNAGGFYGHELNADKTFQHRTVQTGLGLSFSVGSEFYITKKILVFVDAFFRKHNVVSLYYSDDYMRDGILEYGIKLGSSYEF
ncbi:MAG: outer membrane beta-barrel protein [Ichthyobacteriaceae bacterium]|nr:outer membrane beta-barrel protein [Ichthyobacteriaceae bacterium]